MCASAGKSSICSRRFTVLSRHRRRDSEEKSARFTAQQDREHPHRVYYRRINDRDCGRHDQPPDCGGSPSGLSVRRVRSLAFAVGLQGFPALLSLISGSQTRDRRAERAGRWYTHRLLHCPEFEYHGAVAQVFGLLMAAGSVNETDDPMSGAPTRGESRMAKTKTKIVKAKSAKAKKVPKRLAKFRPMNVVVAPGSTAEKYYRAMARPLTSLIKPQAIAPGFPPTPEHNLINHGGKTIQNLVYTNFFVGGASSWAQTDIESIDQALAAAMADANLNNVMMQYFNNAPITSTFSPSHILPGTRPSQFSQGDVEQLVKSLFMQGALVGFEFSSTVFNFMLPSGTVLTTDTNPTSAISLAGNAASIPVEDEASSLHGLGGYHGSVHPARRVTIYYAIGVFSERRPNGSNNGIVAFDQPWKNVVATFYHELNEARTDPDVEDAIRAGNSPKAVGFLGWTSQEGEECGDFPITEAEPDLSLVMKEVSLTDGDGKVPVQFQYSNAVQGPEGPILQPHV
jgi:hypothetical protein